MGGPFAEDGYLRQFHVVLEGFPGLAVAVRLQEEAPMPTKLKIRPLRWNNEFDFDGEPELTAKVLAYLGLPKSKVKCINSEDDADFEKFQDSFTWTSWDPASEAGYSFVQAEKGGRKYLLKGEYGMYTLYGPADGFVLED